MAGTKSPNYRAHIVMIPKVNAIPQNITQTPNTKNPPETLTLKSKLKKAYNTTRACLQLDHLGLGAMRRGSSELKGELDHTLYIKPLNPITSLDNAVDSISGVKLLDSADWYQF